MNEKEALKIKLELIDNNLESMIKDLKTIRIELAIISTLIIILEILILLVV